MKEIRFYYKLIYMHILSAVEYKGWWLMLIHVLFYVLLEPFGTVMMFLRFGSIGTWTMERILLVYALAVTSFGIAKTFLRGFDTFPSKMVRGGDFDRLLLRPKSLFTQTAASTFHLYRLSQPLSGIAIIIWCLIKLDISLTPLNLFVLITALIGGTVTYAGVFVMTSGIAFFTVKAVEWIYVFTNASYQVTLIPYEILPCSIKIVYTFWLPLLVISDYPASAICDWNERLGTGFLALPAGLVVFGASMFVWRFGIRHYRSTGS